MDDALKQLILQLLGENRIMTIATNRPDGWPQATVVGYVKDGVILYGFIARESQKYANIARDPRVSVAIAPDYPHPLQIKGLSMAARVGFFEDREEFARVMALMMQRYPECATFPLPALDDVPLMRIVPEVVSVLDYSKGFGHADLLHIEDGARAA
jgi:hypothetical protein